MLSQVKKVLYIFAYANQCSQLFAWSAKANSQIQLLTMDHPTNLVFVHHETFPQQKQTQKFSCWKWVIQLSWYLYIMRHFLNYVPHMTSSPLVSTWLHPWLQQFAIVIASIQTCKWENGTCIYGRTNQYMQSLRYLILAFYFFLLMIIQIQKCWSELYRLLTNIINYGHPNNVPTANATSRLMPLKEKI